MTAERPERESFGRNKRLQRSGEFAWLKQRGQRLVQGCLIANWSRREDGPHCRLGVVTSRKIGGAVVRNRARRLLRESFRKHQNEFSEPVNLVLIARASIVGKTLSQVEKDLLTTLRKTGLLKVRSGESTI